MGDSTQKSTHKRKRIELSPFEDPDPSKTSKTTSDKIDLSFDSTYHCLDKLHQKIAKLNDEAEEKRKTLEKRVQQLESQNGDLSHQLSIRSTRLMAQDSDIKHFEDYRARLQKEVTDAKQESQDLKDATKDAKEKQKRAEALLAPTSDKFEKLREMGKSLHDDVLKRVMTLTEMQKKVDQIDNEEKELKNTIAESSKPKDVGGSVSGKKAAEVTRMKEQLKELQQNKDKTRSDMNDYTFVLCHHWQKIETDYLAATAGGDFEWEDIDQCETHSDTGMKPTNKPGKVDQAARRSKGRKNAKEKFGLPGHPKRTRGTDMGAWVGTYGVGEEYEEILPKKEEEMKDESLKHI